MHRGARRLSTVCALGLRGPGPSSPVASCREGSADRGRGRLGEVLTPPNQNQPPPSLPVSPQGLVLSVILTRKGRNSRTARSYQTLLQCEQRCSANRSVWPSPPPCGPLPGQHRNYTPPGAKCPLQGPLLAALKRQCLGMRGGAVQTQHSTAPPTPGVLHRGMWRRGY